MKYTILIETRTQNSLQTICENPDIRQASLPYENADHLIVEGSCPLCSKEVNLLFKVKGDPSSKVEQSPLLFFCVGYCVKCNAPVGTLRVEVETIFGEEEDRAVLRGRPRVY